MLGKDTSLPEKRERFVCSVFLCSKFSTFHADTAIIPYVLMPLVVRRVLVEIYRKPREFVMSSSLDQLMKTARNSASGQGSQSDARDRLRQYNAVSSPPSALFQRSMMGQTSTDSSTLSGSGGGNELGLKTSVIAPTSTSTGAGHAPLADLPIPSGDDDSSYWSQTTYQHGKERGRTSEEERDDKPVTPTALQALFSQAARTSESNVAATNSSGTAAHQTRKAWEQEDGPMYKGVQCPPLSSLKQLSYEGLKVPVWTLPNLPRISGHTNEDSGDDDHWPSHPRLSSDPIMTYQTERPKKSYRLLATSSCFRCYPVKRTTIRVTDQKTKAKAYLKGHTHDILDMELCPCGSISDTLLASIDTRGQVCLFGLRTGTESNANNVMYKTHLFTLLAPRGVSKSNRSNRNEPSKGQTDCFRVSWAPPSIADSGRVLLVLTPRGLFAVDVSKAEHEEGVGGIIDLTEHDEKQCISRLWSPEPDTNILPSSFYICPSKYGARSALISIGCSQLSENKTPQYVIVGLLTITPRREVVLKGESIRRVTLSKSLFSHREEKMYTSRVEHVMLQSLDNDRFVLCVGGYNATMWLTFSGEVNLRQKRPVSLLDTATMRVQLPGLNESLPDIRYHPILDNRSAILFLAAEHSSHIVALAISERDDSSVPVFRHACCFRISEPCVALTVDNISYVEADDEEILALYAVLRTSINEIECHYKKCRPNVGSWPEVDVTGSLCVKKKGTKQATAAPTSGQVGSLKILPSKSPRAELDQSLQTLPEEPYKQQFSQQNERQKPTTSGTGDEHVTSDSKENAIPASEENHAGIRKMETALIQRTEEAVSSSIRSIFATKGKGNKSASVTDNLVQSVSVAATQAVKSALKEESRSSIVPAIEKASTLGDPEITKIVDRLHEKILPDLHRKVMQSLRPITEELAQSLAQQVAAEISPIVSSTFEQAFSGTLLPGLESATQKMITEMKAALHAEAQEASRYMRDSMESDLNDTIQSLKASVDALKTQQQQPSDSTNNGHEIGKAGAASNRSTTPSGRVPSRTQDCDVEVHEPEDVEAVRRLKGTMQRSEFNPQLYETAFRDALEKEDVTVPLWLCAAFPRQKHLRSLPRDAAAVICMELSDISLSCLLQQLSLGASSIPNGSHSAALFILWIAYTAVQLEKKVAESGNRFPMDKIVSESGRQLHRLWQETGYAEELRTVVENGKRALKSIGNFS